MMKSIAMLAILLMGLTSCNHGRPNPDDTVVVVPPVLVVVVPPIVLPTAPELGDPVNTGPDAVDLGSVKDYVILAKTGVSNVTGSSVVGNLGVSPVAASYITGFALAMDSSNKFSLSSSVTGRVYAADYANPTPGKLTSAVNKMETAYNEAAGRPHPDHVELGAGNIGGLTLTPGLYKWSSNVVIPVDVVLSGGPNDVFIMQIAGNLTLASAKNVILTGGVKAKNVFWQVAGKLVVEPSAHFEGIVLCKTAIVIQTKASVNGGLYAQTAVTLDNNNITQQ